MDGLIACLSPVLLRFLSARTPGYEDAQDVLQDFWLRLHRARNTYRPSEPALPWIFAIARHTSLDARRRRQRLLAREMSTSDIPEHLHQTLQPDVAESDFLLVLDQLPERQREVIVMLKVSGMSLEEVARATSATVGAIKQRAHRAYGKLRVILTTANQPARSAPEV